jgi:3-isopropylmalate/(R)-2-methylmalate dehydratase small subunit
MSAKFTTLTSRMIRLLVDNIDTDQIIPARFLKTTERAGLGKHVFSDWRKAGDFVLDRPESQGVQVLLAGDNFGSGSSREHAPWALTDWGLRAVISTRFADIFRNNAMKNGLLPVVVSPAVHARLAGAPPDAEVTVDLQAQQLTLPDGDRVEIPIDPFVRKCMLEGKDELGYLLGFADAIAAYEARHG